MSDPQPGLSRRGLLAGAVGVAGVLGGTQWWLTEHPGPIPLLEQTVAWTRPDQREFVQDPSDVVPNSRVLADATSRSDLLAGEQVWRSAAPTWLRDGPWPVLADSALLDLRVLTLGLPATVAGWSQRWRYVWPRDASTAAAALATIGQRDAALANLHYLQKVQSPDGWFQARYDPLTGRAPDDRTRQLDGVGWALWATDQVRRVLTSGADQAVASLADLVRRSTALILQVTDHGYQLPPAGPDYWEVSEKVVTLGTVGMLAAGLEAATHLLPIIGDEASTATLALRQFDELIAGRFEGFPRHADGDDPDVSVVFLMPPFRAVAAPGSLEALLALEPRITRPGGGLAPGVGWRDDGISWTPETALVALGYAGSGQDSNAAFFLNWLQDHRTAAGSLPEKVLASGEPAAVAPLSWTASSVLLAISRLPT